MRRSAGRLTCLLLMLAALTPGSSRAQSTASAASDRARALREIEASQTSNLNAVPALVDRSLDRQVHTDVQEIASDPSLAGVDANDPDGRASGLSTSSAELQIRSRTISPTATSWSHLPAAVPTTQAEPALSDLPEQPVDQPILFPAESIASAACDRFSPDISARDPDTNSSRPAARSRSQAQRRERAKRQARELEKMSDQQCGQLRSGETECRLKLKKNHADVSPDDLQSWR